MKLSLLIDLIIAIASLTGFCIALYIFSQKEKEQPMTCPIGLDCHVVVHSEYSKFLGMRIEVLGFLYYAFVFVSTALFYFLPSWSTPTISLIFWAISLGAVLFSIYLTLVQTLVIRHLCSWCVISAFLTVVIGLLTTISQFSL